MMKGISPLLAIIVGIILLIATGLILSGWLTKMLKFQTGKVENATSASLSCSLQTLELTSASCSAKPPRLNSTFSVVLLRFDEGSGTLAKDEAGYDNNASLQGGASWVDGKFSSALSFEAGGSYANTSSFYWPYDEASLELWVRPR